MSLSARDQACLWHPFTQAKIEGLPIGIVRAKGCTLFTEDGREIIDAVSSWWVNIHGHSHPYIAERIAKQAATLEHVIFAGFTHAPAVELAEQLLRYLPSNQKRIFYSDNGSTAVETALKMAMQYLHQSGQSRQKVISFHGGYHGDTFGAMSANAPTSFYKPFAPYLFQVQRIAPPQSQDDAVIAEFEAMLGMGDVGIFIFEPIVQAVAGMRIHSPAGLNRMLELCRKHGVVTIADEVFTGFGRTGRFFACDYLEQEPDIVCISKGITGGFLPLGVTSSTQAIFDAFYSDDRGKMFFHGHSYTANPIACSAALASLELLQKPEASKGLELINECHRAFLVNLKSHSLVKGAAVVGTILRFEIESGADSGYLSSLRDRLYAGFLKRGVLLRPLGNIIYVLPPYCVTKEELLKVYSAIEETLEELAKATEGAHEA
ncbi:MAG: adenosylmethionine--8-amino-7-oxononanoate transaminase [Deltaproteobacteria bacterium]|nr:adenosylmethionine--8-amino-7-oxononanoate transaminase [Deltaproteobacteria bacterium]